MKTNILRPNLLLITAFILGACAEMKPEHRPAAAATPQEQEKPAVPPVPSNCEIRKSIFNENSAHWVQAEEQILIERQLQRVIRYTCDGGIKSDKIETVKPPHHKLSLRNPLPDRKFKSVFIFNEATCDHLLKAMPAGDYLLFGALSSVTGDGQKSIEVKGDLSRALLTFQLQEGLNKVFVAFHYDCHPRDIPGNTNFTLASEIDRCEKSVDYRIAEYLIFVRSEEKTLPGAQEIKPTQAECIEPEKQK